MSYNGEERRRAEGGRREGDTCSEHCFYVAEWNELRSARKEDIEHQERKNEAFQKSLNGKSPLILVIALIATVVLTTIMNTGYTFRTSTLMAKDFADTIAKVQKDFSEKLSNQSQLIVTQLYKINTDLEVAKARQNDIKALIIEHKEETRKKHGKD